MYNFNPSTVERVLKDMRILATNGQDAAQQMNAKLRVNRVVASGNVKEGEEGVENTHPRDAQENAAILRGESDGDTATERHPQRASTRQVPFKGRDYKSGGP